LFSIVERYNRYVFGDHMPLRTTRGRASSYEICPLFTYSICYREVYRLFPKEEGDLLGRIIYGEKFPLGWKFLGVNFSGEILHGENLPELVYRMFVICLFSRC
jgi:hypothetical protein